MSLRKQAETHQTQTRYRRERRQVGSILSKASFLQLKFVFLLLTVKKKAGGQFAWFAWTAQVHSVIPPSSVLSGRLFLFFRLLVISYSSTLHLSLMLFGHINATLEASGNHLDT